MGRRRFLLAAAFCLVLGGLGGLLAAAVEPTPAPARYRFVPPRGPGVRLHAEGPGRAARRRSRSARGKVIAVTFLYSTCHDLCPAEAVLIGNGDGAGRRRA